MNDLELVALFTGYGYQGRFVEFGPLAESDEEEKKKDTIISYPKRYTS